MSRQLDAKISLRIDPKLLLLFLASACLLVAPTNDSLVAADGNVPAGGEDWPGFLGPRGTGVSGETLSTKPWPQAGPPVIWKKRLGTGYGAPSILSHRLVVHYREGDEEIVECVDAGTGKNLWTYKNPSQFRDPYGYNNGPRCSPVLVGNRCYTLGAAGWLACLELSTGNEIWSKDTQAEFKVPDAFFGVGATPILEGELLIVPVGGQPDSGLVAFERESGKVVWQAIGKSTWDGADTSWPSDPIYRWTGEEMVISYASPIAATIHGKRHLLFLARQGLVSVDPSNGQLNFRYWFCSRTYESVNAARPVVIDDKIFLSAAYRVGSTLVQVAPDGKSVQELWTNPRNMLAHWSTPIHDDGFIYGFSGRHEKEGELRCIDVETGKIRWKTTGFAGNLNDLALDRQTGRIINRKTREPVPHPFYGRGSQLQVGDHFIVLGERGTLALVKIDPDKFIEISRTQYPEIRYPAWAAPILSRKRLFIRTEDHLLCLDMSGS